jgi:DNA repair protein RadC
VGACGGRTWWAHLKFARINVTPTILRKQIEELMNVRGIGEASFLKLKALVTVTPPRTERAAAQ